MSRRRQTDSSLELLLDTITNTFGGVLFVAMLVSLMLRTAPVGHQVEEDDPSERARLESRLSILREREEEITKRVEKMRESAVAGDAANPDELLSLHGELLSLATERTGSIEAIARYQADATRAQERVAELADAADDAHSALTTATESLNVQQAEAVRLAALMEEAGRTPEVPEDVRAVGFPTLAEMNRMQVGIMARYGRLYMMHTWRNGVRMGPNTEDFVVFPGSPQVARARPTGGVPTDAASVKQFVKRLAGSFPPDEWVVAMVVHADSFGSFATIRKALIEAGYKYSPLPLPPGGTIVDEGGRAEGQ